MNGKVSPKRFAFYMCGLLVGVFFVGMVVFILTRPFFQQWAVVPGFVSIVISAAIGGARLGKSIRINP